MAVKRPLLQRSMLLLLLLPLILYLFPLPLPAAAAKEAPMLTVYFPNWNVHSAAYSQVKDLPWDHLDCIHHAFWKVVRSGSGFAVCSTDPWADTDEGNPQAHFPQYARLTGRYPHVKVMLAIGGWTCSGLFSEMASTPEGRASFIQSCVDTLNVYPFLSGVDIDWEYPGVERKGSGQDEGNPVAGDDFVNYTLLLKELRAAFTAAFGARKKMITVCAGASVGTLTHQDYASLFPFVDRINLMTYDLTGAWEPCTGHHTPLYGNASADAAVKYLQSKGVPAAKIAIGAPLYSHGWKMDGASASPVGASASGLSDGDLLWSHLNRLEASAVPPGTPGWHAGYDEQARAAYLWNDDPASDSFLHFYSYESTRSLDAKLDYIFQHSLGGLIVWQSGGDDSSAGWPMLRRMHQRLHR